MPTKLLKRHYPQAHRLLLLHDPNLPLDHYLPDLDLLQTHQSHRILDRDSYRPNLPVLGRGPKVVLPLSAVGLYF
jgi:hypothetical protein